METLGAIVLIPTLVVFALAIITHRPIESLISGSVVGLIIVHSWQFTGGIAPEGERLDTYSARHHANTLRADCGVDFDCGLPDARLLLIH